MKKNLFLFLTLATAMGVAAQSTQHTYDINSQELFDQWESVSGTGDVLWTYSTSNSCAAWAVPTEVPSQGTILAYKESVGMKAGECEATARFWAGTRSSGKCFEIVISTTSDFSDIVASVKYGSAPSVWSTGPIGMYASSAFNLSEDGMYYFGIRVIPSYTNLSNNTTNTVGGNDFLLSNVNLTFEDYDPNDSGSGAISLDEPWTEEFASAAALSDFTIVGGTTNYKWEYTSGYVKFAGSNTTPTCTLVTPAFEVAGGTTYKVTFNTWASLYMGNSNIIHTLDVVYGSSPENLAASMSDGPQIVAATTQLSDAISYTFTAAEDGIVYIGFKGQIGQNSNICIDNITVEKSDDSSITPEPGVDPISLTEPYTNSLATTEDVADFTLNSWSVASNNSQAIALNGGGNAAETSAVISPAFAVEENKTYQVSFDFWKGNGAGNASLKVSYGTSVDDLSTEIGTATIEALVTDHWLTPFTFTATATQTVYFSFEGTAPSRNSVYLNNLVIQEYTAPAPVISLTEPYTNSLATAEDVADFTLNSWSVAANNSQAIALNGGGTAAETSAVISPAFAVEENKTYQVSFDFWKGNGAGNASLKVSYGTSVDDLSTEIGTATIEALVTEHWLTPFTFTATATQTVYFSFEGTAPSRNTVYLNNLVIQEYTAPAPVISLTEPYTNSLATTEDVADFTLNSWSVAANNSQAIALNGGGTAAETSAVISPAFAVEENKTYQVSFDFWKGNGAGNASLKVSYGTSVDDLSTEIGTATIEALVTDHWLTPFTFTATATQTVYFSFEGTAPSRNTVYLNNLVIQEYTAPAPVISLTEPYTNSLATAEDVADFTLNSWSVASNNSQAIALNGGGTAAETSAVISPAFAVEENKTYQVSFDFWKGNGAGNASLKVSYGTSVDDLSTEIGTATIEALVTEHWLTPFTFTATATQTVYFSFEGTAPSRNTVYLNNLVIQEYTAPAAEPFLEVGEVTWVANADGSVSFDVPVTAQNIADDLTVTIFYTDPVNNNYEVEVNDQTDGVFHFTMTGLDYATTYSTTIYAMAGADWSEDVIVEFTTADAPVVATVEISDVTYELEGATISFTVEFEAENVADDAELSAEVGVTLQEQTKTETPSITSEEEGKVDIVLVNLVNGTYDFSIVLKYTDNEGNVLCESEPYEVNDITVDNQTGGINSAIIDSQNARFFDLKGVEIKNPQTGMFIKLENGTSSKILLKE